MLFAEVIVNVPIRRTFVRSDAPSNIPPADNVADEANDALQTFHYHLPPEPEGRRRLAADLGVAAASAESLLQPAAAAP